MSSLQFFSILLDDKCQFWLNESTKVLTSPYFGSLYGSGQHYPHNLNCTWILKAEEGSIINIEIDYSMVKKITLPPSSLLNRVFINSKLAIATPYFHL